MFGHRRDDFNYGMAKDEIIGTAVLCTEGPVQWLYYLRTVAKLDGAISGDELPVMPEEGPPPSQPLPSWFPENRPWRYKIVGDMLHVQPSVHIKDFFHNEGSWTVKFVRASGVTRFDHYRQLTEVNAEIPNLPDTIKRLGE